MKAILHSFLFILLVAGPAQATPIGSSIRYNGHLRENGVAANGGYDIKFSLWDSATAGTQVGPTVTLTGVTVEDGVLSASPDFGDVFDGNAYWLELEVRKGNSGNFTVLNPRQSLEAAPYALHAPKSGVADSAKGVGQNAVHSGGLQNGAVTGDKITSKGVGNGHLDDASVNGRVLQNGAVTGDKITSKGVGNGHLDDASVNGRVLENGAVGGNKIASKGVGNGHLDDGTVDGRVLQNGVVTGGKLAPNTITADKIAPSHVVKSLNALKDDVTLAAGSGITLTPAGNTISIAAIPAAPGWNLSGNAGTAPPADFLGTTDQAALNFRVGNQLVMRYVPTVDVPNVLGGGAANTVQPGVVGVTISGGGTSTLPLVNINMATDNFGTIGGGAGNQAGNDNPIAEDARFATVGGGSQNRAKARNATIAGGEGNVINSAHGTIGGGWANEVNDDAATIGGGFYNVLYAVHGTIGGGQHNWISPGASYSTIAGGSENQIDSISGQASTIAGGENNVITTGFGTIPGGFSNTVAGAYGLAAGYRAQAAHQGAFVWADSTQREFASTDNDEFSVRATGGTRFVSGFTGPGDNTLVGVRLSPGAGSWSSLSDRNTKTNVQPVATREVLEHLARLPISTWNYRSQEASVRHIGPMAQDFAAAFQVGEDNTHISTVDADGVALAAIQGLYEMLRERDASIVRLEKRLAELEKRVADRPAGSDERGTP